MLTLLSTLISFLMSGTPKFLEFFQDKNDKAHELELARMQIGRELELKRAGLEIEERIEAIRSDQIEMQTTASTAQAIIGAQQADLLANLTMKGILGRFAKIHPALGKLPRAFHR